MSERTRVLHVITRMVHGGAQLIVLELLARLDPERYEVHLAAGAETGAEGSLWDRVEALGVPSKRIDNLVRNLKPWSDWRALRELQRHIRELSPAIVHSHTSKAGLIGCVAAKRARVPAVILAPHGHILGPSAKIPGVPERGWKRWLLATVARQNCRYADIVVAPNEVERQDGIAHGMWREENSVTIANGVDTRRFRPGDATTARDALDRAVLETCASGRPRARIGCVARLASEKGIDVVVDAIIRLADVDLVIIGDGPERDALEARAAAAGTRERVHFLGVRHDVDELIGGLDALIVPSHTEAHGLVAAEGLASGVPTIVSDVGGLRSIVKHEETGLRFTPGAVDELVVAVQRIAGDSELRQRLTTRGRQYVVEHFSLDAMITATEALYGRLLGRAEAPSAAASGSAREVELQR